MSKYIALTIGSISKTLNLARSTKEIWAGSYLFSYIMKNIINKLRNDKEINFISYDVSDERIFQKQGVGLFYDRFIFKSENSKYELVEKKINSVISEVSNEIKNDFGKRVNYLRKNLNKEDDVNNRKKIEYLIKLYSDSTKEEIENYLKNYFQIYFLESENSSIDDLNNYLDSFELQGKVIPKDEVNYIKLYLESINKTSFLWNDNFEKDFKFFSLARVALHNYFDLEISKEKAIELEKKYFENENIDEQNILDKLNDILESVDNEKEINLKSYYKYIAIVYADGDNFSKLISTLSEDRIVNLSESIQNFSINSKVIINNYEAMPIFAGGDDLLFFAPIKTKKGHIFNLLDELSTLFHKEVLDKFEDEIEKLKESHKPSLSFGLSITYHRFPLYEALRQTRDELKKAKSGKKNAISFRVLKHSGQYFGAKFDKSSNSYIKFKELITTSLKDTNILNALHYKLEAQKFIIKEIARDKDKLQNFFDNNFNESIHKENEFLKSVKAYMDVVFSEYKFEEAFKLIFSSLRMIKFLKGKEI